MKKNIFLYFILLYLIVNFTVNASAIAKLEPTQDDGKWFFLKASDTTAGAHHTKHAEIFGKYVTGYNHFVLDGIDKVQSHAMDGGGYFAGVTAKPAESPIGYELKLFGNSLLNPPRKTSYCSGASYTAFIESLNLIFSDGKRELSDDRAEAVRMQELDGGRREDNIKYWGYWNADGFGSHFALVQYSGMGKEIKPENARPGDFMNISWKKGAGHSVVFLGWYKGDTTGNKVLYWASQTGTNGLGDQLVSIDRIKEAKIVRMTEPGKLFKFNISQSVDHKIPGDTIHW